MATIRHDDFRPIGEITGEYVDNLAVASGAYSDGSYDRAARAAIDSQIEEAPQDSIPPATKGDLKEIASAASVSLGERDPGKRRVADAVIRISQGLRILAPTDRPDRTILDSFPTKNDDLDTTKPPVRPVRSDVRGLQSIPGRRF